MFYVKKFVIWLFNLSDMEDILVKAKKQQKKLDERYWTYKLKELDEKLKREKSLDIQELTAQLTMLQDQVNDQKKREKELNRKEYFLKQQAKENTFMATKIDLKVGELANAIIKISAEMKGIKTESEDHKERIESK